MIEPPPGPDQAAYVLGTADRAGGIGLVDRAGVMPDQTTTSVPGTVNRTSGIGLAD